MKLISVKGLLFSIIWLGFSTLSTVVSSWGTDYSTTSPPGNDGVPEISAPEKGKKQLLTLKQAFEMGLQNSSEIKRVRYQPLQAAEEYNKAKTIYDPELFSTGTAERTDRPVQSLLEGVPVDSNFLDKRWQVQAGIRERLPTGGSIALYQEGGGYETNDSNTIPNPQYPSKVNATLSQPLLKGFGDKEGATSIHVASLNLQIAEAAFKRDISNILLEISNNYWQLFFEQNNARIVRNSIARAKDVYEREKVREIQGLSMSIDVDRALVAINNRRSSLLRSQNQERLTIRKLWMLIAPEHMADGMELPDPALQQLPITPFDQLERSYYRDEALNVRQEIAIARNSIEISEQQDSLAAHNKLPQMDLKLGYGPIGLSDVQDNLLEDPYNNDFYDWQVELAFEWPIGGRSAAAEKRKTMYQLQQSRTELSLMGERVTQEVDLSLDELLLAEEELQVTKIAMEAAYRVLKGEETMFELGKKNNRDLLEVQDFYGSAEKEYLRAQARYNMNLVSLAHARGTLLTDYGLNVEALLTASKNIEQ